MKSKKGISLIVLIVTIIVVIILAAAVILTLSRNNPVESAREATFKEDVRAFQDELALAISKEYTEKQGQRDKKITENEFEKIKKYIPSFTEKYKGKFVIENDKLVGTDTLTEKENEWSQNLQIKTEGGIQSSGNNWDKTASPYECFVWDGNTIVGYNEDAIVGLTTLRIPSKCTAIRADYATAWNGYRNFVGGITKVEIPNTVTEIGDYAFLGFKFEEITIPDSVVTIGKGAFMGCTNLSNITLPNNLKTIGEQAFGAIWDSDPRCESLKSIVIPDSVESIGRYAFSYCTNLESVTLSKNIKSIGYSAFNNCHKLSNIQFPEGLLTIESDAFYNCNLGKVIIPRSVTTMGESVFERANCTSPIYCRIESKPNGWDSDWNISADSWNWDEPHYYTVSWGYTGE